MATGGFKSSATTDFLEEWKAKREKMRAKMLGDIAAATGAPLGATNANSSPNSRHAPPPPPPPTTPPPSPAPSSPGTELPFTPERSASAGSCQPSASRCSSSGAAAEPCASPDSSSPMACNDSDKESPSPGKGKKSSGPSARKGKGQIEKRKLREKRRSTGVVSIPSNESLDELDDDDVGEKGRREEEELVQANTFQNESMTADAATGHLMDAPRSGTGRHKSSTQGCDDEARQRHNRQGRDGGAAGSLEKRIEDLEKELARERQENGRLQKAHQDKDELIEKMKEEIELLYRDLDDLEDENDQLKQENKTLLKVVGQLTR